MADNIPNVPTGAVPPKKETGKVQPKKETVRINLPPKPSAAPTIKLPTLPPGGPTVGAQGKGPTAAPSHAPPPATAAPRASAAPVAQQRPVTQQRLVGAPAAAAMSPVDKVLAIVAAVIGLVAVGSTAYIAFML